MRVLWVCNIMLPFIGSVLGVEVSNKEGWLTGLADKLMEEKGENAIVLGVAFPVATSHGLISGRVEEVSYYGFYEEVSKAEKYDVTLEERIKFIINDFRPDVVHIFGTEYAHSLAAVRAFNRPERTLVGIQGVCSEYAKVYPSDLPFVIQKRFTFRDFLKRDNIQLQQQKFVKRGHRETLVIEEVMHVTGRTEFDYDYTVRTNEKVSYHFMNETLRSNFYTEEWEMETCQPFQIFISQGDYPIKGLHYVIEALPLIKAKFPQVKVVVAGDKVLKGRGWSERLKLSSYGKYLRDLMKEKGVIEDVTFLGRLNASDMKRTYLSSHIFLCPSRIENSPNSVGEAMVLGMPVIATNVGGISSLLKDGEEGLLYTHNQVLELVDCVIRIFEDREVATSLGLRARKRAFITHDATINYQKLLEIYHEINLCI